MKQHWTYSNFNCVSSSFHSFSFCSKIHPLQAFLPMQHFTYMSNMPLSLRERETKDDTLSEYTFPILPLISLSSVHALLHFETVKLELQARQEIFSVHVWLSIHASNSTVPDSCPLSFFCYCYGNSLLSCCFMSTEARWPVTIRDGDRVGRERQSEGLTAETVWKRPERPWTAARTMEALRRCPFTIAQRLVHCAIAVSAAVLDRVTKTMSVAPLLTNNLDNSKQKTSNLLHLHTHDLFWANLRVQLHLPPLRSLDL